MSQSQFSATSYKVRGGYKWRGRRYCKRESFVTEDFFSIQIVSVPLKGYRYKVSHPCIKTPQRGLARKRRTLNHDICTILAQLRELVVH